VVLEKKGDDQLDRICEKLINVSKSQGGGKCHTKIKKGKANWIGHILGRNCLLKHVTEGKIGGWTEVKGRRGRRSKRLLDDLKRKRGYCKLTEEALNRNLWRTRFGRGHGPVVRQTTG
jgi:hypothetical protein